MVTYGPWQDGREYTETWTLGIIPEGAWAGNLGITERTMTPYPTPVDGSTPPTIAQWDGFSGLRLGDLLDRGTTRGEVALEGPPEVADPRFDTPQVSGDAWSLTREYSAPDMHNDPAGALLNEGGITSANMRYSGSFEPEVGSFDWTVHRETWQINHSEYTPRYSVRPNVAQPFMQIPVPPTPRHLYAEIDPARATTARLSEAVSLKVDYLIEGDIKWHFFVKDIGDVSPGWMVGGEPDGDKSVNGLKSGSLDVGYQGTYEFDVSLINQWKILNGTSQNAYFVPGYLMPHIGVAWTGLWPGDWKGTTNEYPALPTATFTYVFNTPRWRWVMADVEPYRRTHPIDGGVPGKSRRTYPPSRALMSSNRTSGGHL